VVVSQWLSLIESYKKEIYLFELGSLGRALSLLKTKRTNGLVDLGSSESF
jgi:hypothetical protein